MEVTYSEFSNGVVICLKGKAMLGYEANDFQNVVIDSIKNDRKKIVVDLNEVEFISSWGIGILMHGYTTAINNEGSFKLARVPLKVQETLRKVKLNEIIEQHNSVEEAIKE